MTTTQFLDDLEKELKGRKIPRKDIEAAREFYDEAIAERIDSGMSEDEAIADLGSIEDIARTTYEENPPIKKTIAGMSIPLFALFIALALLSSVLWAPFLVVFLVLFIFIALTPLGIELALLYSGIVILWTTMLCFYRGEGNLTVWFLTCIAIGIIGASIALTSLSYRAVELAGRALTHGTSYVTALFSTRTPSRNTMWYKPVFTVRKFDKIVLIAGGTIAGIGILGAFGIWASVGFDVNALPPVDPILLGDQEIVIDIVDLHIGTK